jgi:3-carboxy-cis,cis-muconate cycloisomerase
MRNQVMQASVIDSAIFRDIFDTDAMRRVWSDENRTRRYLEENPSPDSVERR